QELVDSDKNTDQYECHCVDESDVHLLERAPQARAGVVERRQEQPVEQEVEERPGDEDREGGKEGAHRHGDSSREGQPTSPCRRSASSPGRGGGGSLDPGKAYTPPRPGAAPGSAACRRRRPSCRAQRVGL